MKGIRYKIRREKEDQKFLGRVGGQADTARATSKEGCDTNYADDSEVELWVENTEMMMQKEKHTEQEKVPPAGSLGDLCMWSRN